MAHGPIFRLSLTHSQNRLELPDFLRGAAMLLVLIHHSDLPGNLGQWILAFHMPLMFLLSGYTMHLHPRTGPFGDFLIRRLKRLVVPYFLFEGINLLVWSVSLYFQGGWQDMTEAVTAIAACLNTEGYTGYYGRLWFWPCMFVSDCFLYWILRLAPKKQPLRRGFLFAMIPALFVLSWYSCYRLPGRLPFTLDTAFMATGFLLAGYLAGPALNRLLQQKRPAAEGCLLLAGLLGLIYAMARGRSAMLMFTNSYGHYGDTLLAAFSGCLVFLVLCKRLYSLLQNTRLPKNTVLWYGRNSLATFPMHLSVKACIYQLLPLSFRQWYILLPAMFLLNIPLVNLVTEYCPFLLGNFRLPGRKKADSR